MEILMLVVVGLLIFFGLRTLMRRQAGRMQQRLQEEINERNARIAASALNDEQHKAIYQAIAAEDGRKAMALFKEATGASVRDCIIGVQSLHQFPQSAPSELSMQEDLDTGTDTSEQVQEEYLEDAIDDVLEGTEEPDHNAEGPLAEADPETGKIVGDNADQVPDVPGSQARATEDDDVDSRARELMEESGFDPEQELTVPENWTSGEDEQAGFHLEVQRGEEKITLSHDDLEPWVHDQLYALLRDDNVDEAAELLAANSPLTAEEAHRFLVVFKDQE